MPLSTFLPEPNRRLLTSLCSQAYSIRSHHSYRRRVNTLHRHVGALPLAFYMCPSIAEGTDFYQAACPATGYGGTEREAALASIVPKCIE